MPRFLDHLYFLYECRNISGRVDFWLATSLDVPLLLHLMQCDVVSQIVDTCRPFIGWTWECVLTLPLVFPRGFIFAALKASLFFFLLFLFSFFSELFSSKFSSSRISFSGKTHLPSLLIYVFLMVNYSEVRLAFPSVCFFFARFGVFLESSIGHYSKIGLFISWDCAYRPVLTYRNFVKLSLNKHSRFFQK